MPEKNQRFQEWLEKFNRLMNESIAEQRRIYVKAGRASDKKAIKRYHLPTQVIRQDIVRKLIQLYEKVTRAGDPARLMREMLVQWSEDLNV